MDFYIRDKDGNLVKATKEQIAARHYDLLDADGNVLVPKAEDIKPDKGTTDKDPVEELTGLIKDLVTNVSAMKTRQEEMEDALKAYQDAAKRGFVAPNGEPIREEHDTDYGYDLKRQGKRLMDKFVHPSHVIDPETNKQLAKYYSLVVRAGVFHDAKAQDEFRKEFGDYISKTAVGDPGNVFPVPDIVDSEVLTFARETSVLLQYGRVWDMTSEKQSFPAETGSATASWGNTTQESEPTISEVELSAEELSCYSTVKNATLADSRTDIVSWLTEALAEAAALALDDEAFNGNGSNVCSGLLTAAVSYSVVMSSGNTAFSSVTFTDLSNLIAKLSGKKKIGARFFMSGNVFHYVRTLKDSNNRPIFVDTVGGPMSGQILGYPYTEVTVMPTSSAANTAFIVFGNLRYFAAGRRLGTTTLQVDPYGLFTTNRTRFKLYQRWGLQVGLADGFARLLTAAS